MAYAEEVGTATSFLNQVLHLGPAVDQRGGARRTATPEASQSILQNAAAPREPGWGGGKATPHPRILPPLVCTCKTKSQEREEANARRSQKVRKERRQMQGIPPTHALRNRRHRMLRMLGLGPSHVISWVGPAPLHAIRRRRVAMKGSKQRCRYSLFRRCPCTGLLGVYMRLFALCFQRPSQPHQRR